MMDDLVQQAAPLEELVIEAYERGWREGCETLIEEYPDERIAVPHKDAMGEGCGTFLSEVWPRIKDLTNLKNRV